jgi:hypothetical protein
MMIQPSQTFAKVSFILLVIKSALHVAHIKYLQVLQHTPSKPRAVVESDVNQILDRYRPIIQDLVSTAREKAFFGTWVPKTRSDHPAEAAFRNHIEQLAIPDVLGDPSLLLHDLASKPNVMDDKQATFIDKVFSLNRHTSEDNFPLCVVLT